MSARGPDRHGHTWGSSEWLSRLPDRKWHLRQASLSASLLTSRRQVVTLEELGGGPSPKTRAPDTEYLHFQGWSLDDDYACTVVRQMRLEDLRVINLSENRLTEKFVHFLVEASQRRQLRLESLQLAKNRLGHLGGHALAKLLETMKCPLKHFDVSDNALGDPAAAQICDSLRQACRGTLRGLNLAKNALGRGRLGQALGGLISSAVNLQSLDLHWNKIDAADALPIFLGLKNNCLRQGQLWRLNLAWNCIGVRCVSPDCGCELCVNCTKAVKMLANVFSDCDTLFHLNLSFNSFSATDCAVFAEALASNRSLFGLHLTGNEAYVDDIGMVRPRLVHQDVPQEMEDLVQRERVRRQVDTWVRHTPQQLRPERLGRLVE
ncbi:unnamed protein product, partial [Effrenium voratum]